MSKATAQKPGPPYEVHRCEVVSKVCYLAPGGANFNSLAAGGLPAASTDCCRVVCISDTHNEHRGLRLPPGDILLHAGDCLTESGTRYVVRRAGVITDVK